MRTFGSKPTPDGTGPIAVLGDFESKSTPGKQYQVRVGSDEVVYCTCRGWVASKSEPRVCTHIKRLNLKRDVWGRQIR